MNFTTLNLLDIISLYLLTIRVSSLTLLNLIRLLLQTTGITYSLTSEITYILLVYCQAPPALLGHRILYFFDYSLVISFKLT